MRPVCLPRHPAVAYLLLVRPMNRSILIAAVIISAAILFNGYLERTARTPSVVPSAEKVVPMRRDKSVGVLPFQDLSSSAENADLASGLQQQVINRLTKVHDLKVASQADVMRYKVSPNDPVEAGRQLGVAHLVEGRVQRSGDRVMVSVQMIDAKTATQLWAETFDRQIIDLFVIGSDIALAVAEAVGAKLSDADRAAIERPTSSP